MTMANRRLLAIAFIIGAIGAVGAAEGARAQQSIGSTAVVQNQVSRELAGASAPLAVGDSVYRNEVVKTGVDSTAKLVFLDSTNLAVGPTSRIVLDRFVYEGDPNAEKVAVGLAKGVFRFTTGNLDKKAYTITTPTAAIGVRGTVLDISVRSADTRVTLVEGLALVCPRKAIGFDQQARNCAAAFGGSRERTLRLRRARSCRANRHGKEGRRDEPGQPDLDAGQFRVALRRQLVTVFGRQLRLFRRSIGRRFVRTLASRLRRRATRLLASAAVVVLAGTVAERARACQLPDAAAVQATMSFRPIRSPPARFRPIALTSRGRTCQPFFPP